MEFISNTVSKVLFPFCRSPMKEACAEFIGTIFLVLCGNGVMASLTLGRLEQHSLLISAFGWGLSLGVGIWISGNVSGGHLNPAVTVALAATKKCSWKKVVPYLVAQYVASFIAATLIHLIYYDAITAFDNGLRQLPPSMNSTAQIFSTYPKDSVSVGSLFFDQVVGTCLLLIVICAATDRRMNRSSSHMEPLIISLGLVVIILAFGHNCGAPLNPARDLAPRLFTAIAGWGLPTFSFRGYMWFWIPVVGPHVGALLGVWLYDLFIDMPHKNYLLLEEVEVSTDTLERDDRLRSFATASKESKAERSTLSVDQATRTILMSSSDEKKYSSQEFASSDGLMSTSQPGVSDV